MKNRIYLDYAATTPVLPEVLAQMLPYFTEERLSPNVRKKAIRKALESFRISDEDKALLRAL